MVKHVLLAVAAAASLLGTGGIANAEARQCALACDFCDSTTSTQLCDWCAKGEVGGIPYEYCPWNALDLAGSPLAY